MKIIFCITLFLISYDLACAYTLSKTNGPFEPIIAKLADKVNSYQVLKEQEYKPPFKWAEKLGLFRSDIKLNFFGNPAVQEVRALASIFDNDMFSTGWIITALLEANIYGSGAPKFDAGRLELALEAIGNYHNHNEKDLEKSIIRTFWPQIFNETYDIWQQQPINIRNIALNIDKLPWEELEKFFTFLKQDKIVAILKDFQELGGRSVAAFCIPPDFDDTYLNLGLGATLSKLKSQYPKSLDNWLKNNTDIDRLAEVTSKYAYRPFETDLNKNVIDPRTYFWVREFIEEAKSTNQSIALITTWIQNIDEQRRLQKESVSMPFNLNNVDVTVMANSVYGITSGAIFDTNGFGELFSKNVDLQQVYLNSTKLISWAIQTNFSSRPDLAQVYYPSTYNFLWYASRTLFLIENEYQTYLHAKSQQTSDDESIRRFESVKEVLFEAKSYLKKAFENEGLDFLERDAIKVDDQQVYFRDFIGLNDTNIFGKPESNDEDALFSTAQAINILLSSWTYQKPDSKKLAWKKETPQNAKDLTQKSVNWLQENIFNKNYKALNAFFSGSVKGFSSLPFWYPANFNQFLVNGTSFNPDTLPEDALGEVLYGVQGVIDEVEYLKELRKPHFNVSTPLDFHGYNTKDNIFPFWSSEPYTYAVSLLAFAQYNNLE